MLKFMYDHKGALSLFTLLLLLPLIIISSLMIDFARAKAAEAQAAAAAETYANSYLSVYDELLNELYGLFAVTQTDTAVLDELKEYMTASFTPGSKDEIRTANTYNSEWFGTEYSDALALMGSSLNSMEARPAKPLVLEQNGTKNYNTLQMQISEYTKFIGPTDLIATGIQSLIKPDDNGQDTEDMDEAESAIANTNKNYKRIKDKDDIDKALGELDKKIKELYNAMGKYEYKLNKYYADTDSIRIGSDEKSVHLYASEEVKSYRGALQVTKDNYDILKIFCENIINSQAAPPQNDTDDPDSDDDSDNENNTDEDSGETYELGLADLAILERILYGREYLMPYNTDNNFNYFFSSSTVGIKYCFTDADEIYKMDIPTYITDYLNIKKETNSGRIVNYNKMKEKINRFIYTNVDESYYAPVVDARKSLKSELEGFESSLNDIKSQIETLVTNMQRDISDMENKNSRTEAEDKELERTKTFLDGIKKDYAPLLPEELRLPEDKTGDVNKDAADIDIIANFDYKGFAEDFASNDAGYAVVSEKNIQQALADAFENSETGLRGYDEYLKDMNDKIKGFVDDFYSDDGDPSEIAAEVLKWMDSTEIIEENDFPDTDIYDITSNVLNDFYTPFALNYNVYSKNNMSQCTCSKLYDVLANWNNASKDGSDEATEDEIDKLKDNLKDILKKFDMNNIKLRGCLENKVMPHEQTSLFPNIEIDDITSFTEVPDLPDNTDVGTKAVNKLLLMVYDYGMFTCQTSDKKEVNGEIIPEAPISYQGITLADPDNTESSSTNFLLYGELEYIFNGSKNPKSNFKSVRDKLAVIRFVPNYISTYTITEINNIVKAIESALSWCPLAAIVAGQAIRIAIASLESWCDLNQLYEGKDVLFYKNKLSNMSFIRQIKEVTDDNTFDVLNKYAKNGNNGNDLNFSDDDDDDGGIKINYKQYLIILSMIFVDSETMLERTSDLIEVNMNYYINGSTVKHQIDLLGNTITTDNDTVSIDKFHMTSANTAVEVTCNVKRDFIFTGKVFNFRNAGYDNVADFADEMNGTESSISSYPYVAVKEY